MPPGSKGKIKLQENVKIDKRFLEWFNRDPERNIPTDPNIIVSPADGVVEYIGEKNGNIHVRALNNPRNFKIFLRFYVFNTS